MTVQSLPLGERVAYRVAQIVGVIGGLAFIAGWLVTDAIDRRHAPKREPAPQPDAADLERARWEAACREAGWNGRRVDA